MRSTLGVTMMAVFLALFAAGIYLWVGRGSEPAPNLPTPLPWTEGEGTVEVQGRFADLSTEDIYYATPKGVWRQSTCQEVRVPLLETPPDSEAAVAFPDPELADEYQSFVDSSGPSYYSFNRCQCRYRVEWSCTKVSRYVTAKAILNGKKYARFIYDRKSWDEEKTLTRRLSALVVTCNSDKECRFYCETATPPYQEWQMQCKGNKPHRILPPSTVF